MRFPRAVNARVVEHVEYGPDPWGGRLFFGITLPAGRAMDGARRVVDPVATFGGYTTSPQSFTGAANLGSSRPVVKTSARLSDERSAGTLTDSATAIFADRLSRRA